MCRTINGNRMTGISRMFAINRDEARLREVEHFQVPALCGDVQPTEPRINGHNIRTFPYVCNDQWQGAGEIHSGYVRVSLARDECALPVRRSRQERPGRE